MNYQDYALRCTLEDKPQLVALGVALGVLQVLVVDVEQPGVMGVVQGTEGSAWDEVGEIEGAPGFWHANLRTTVDLATRAAELGIDASNLARWFLVEPDGRPTMPRTPARVWL